MEGREEMAGSRRSELTRARLLDAALVVARRNASQLTLDAVAAEAGVSKGGLLYHYPDKTSLVSGLLDAMLARFDAALESAVAGDSEPGAWLRAYVDVCADPDASLPDLAPTLLAVVAHEPDLLARMSDSFAVYQQRAVDDLDDAAVATLLRLVGDGLWFADAFSLAAPSGSERAALLALLHRLSRREVVR